MTDKYQQISIEKEAAIDYGETEWWKNKTPHEIVHFQLFTTELCMPFTEFRKNLEFCLGRPVLIREIALNFDGLIDEFLGGKEAPTFQEIVNMIPEDKRLFIRYSGKP